ncbi:hypothetical protein BGZ63DRAFT_390468 [Mariannaea sp. PMI_226]|nr:hypothetical protein BGZ63DRAFT_390468 [Mariannaea sp. PMI_226]
MHILPPGASITPISHYLINTSPSASPSPISISIFPTPTTFFRSSAFCLSPLPSIPPILFHPPHFKCPSHTPFQTFCLFNNSPPLPPPGPPFPPCIQLHPAPPSTARLVAHLLFPFSSRWRLNNPPMQCDISSHWLRYSSPVTLARARLFGQNCYFWPPLFFMHLLTRMAACTFCLFGSPALRCERLMASFQRSESMGL